MSNEPNESLVINVQKKISAELCRDLGREVKFSYRHSEDTQAVSRGGGDSFTS